MVSHQSAQSAAVGSPSAPGAEQDDLGSRLGGRVRPELDHELVHADPAADRRPPAGPADLGPVAGVPGDAVAVAQRHQPDRGRPVGGPGQAVRDPGAGVDLLDVDQLGAQRHHRPQRDAGRGGDRPAPGRSRTRRCPPGPGRAGPPGPPARRPSWPGGAGPAPGRRPGRPRTPRWKAASWIGTEGWPSSSAAARCDQTPTTSSAPASSASAAAAQTSGQIVGGGAVAGQPGVELEVDPGPPLRRGRGGHQPGDLVDRLGRDVDRRRRPAGVRSSSTP